MQHYHDEIIGWFDFEGTYKEAIATVPDGGTLVEIGCYFGKSLSYLLVEAANSGKNLNIVGVDRFPQHDNGDGFPPTSIAAACTHNCARPGYPYTLYAMGSLEAAKFFTRESVDFVFIDADHSFGGVSDDVRTWLPKVKRGGVIAGHDWGKGFPGVEVGVKTHIREHGVALFGRVWKHHKIAPDCGQWQYDPPRPSADWMVYMPCLNNASLLRRSLESLHAHSSTLVVVAQGEQLEIPSRIGHIYRWQSPVRFTTVMNWIWADAQWRGLKRLFFAHSDIVAAPGAISRLLAMADELDDNNEKWGAIFTHYDALACFNVAALSDTGCWDESFAWYVADIDYYNRMKWRGWSFHHCPEALISHVGSATLAAMSDAQREEVRCEQQWAEKHYQHKWAKASNDPEGRAHMTPYNL